MVFFFFSENLQVPTAQTADRIVLAEDTSQGQLVRAFTVEVQSVDDQVGGGWQLVLSKQSIGHKRIVMLPGAGHGQVRVNVSRTLQGLRPKLQVVLYTGEGCNTVPPCGAASPGQQITGAQCAGGAIESISSNQAWELEVVAPNAGVGGSDVVRFKLVSSNASAAPLCLSVFGPPALGEYSNSTTVMPCFNDTFADPFDPGATQRFSFDRSGKGLAGNAILWEGDGTESGQPGCFSVGCEPGHWEQAFLHPNDPWNTPNPLKTCGGGLPFQTFMWVAGPTADVSTLQYATDGHGSGPLCLGACGVMPQCSFEFDYAYAGPAFSTLPGSSVRSCCAACKVDPKCAVFVLNGTRCALKTAMTGGSASPGIVSGDPNRAKN